MSDAEILEDFKKKGLDIHKVQPTPLNRRRFLELTTLGIGGLGLLYQSNSALAAQALPEERADKTAPVIDIRYCCTI
jgi:muramoyltetrapeptide carboxypeptidase